MAVSTRIVLDAPAPIAPRYTLRGAADSSPPLDGHFMYGGDLATYPASPAKGWTICESPPDQKTTSGFPAQEPFDGFVVYLAVTCTTRGLDFADVRRRALASFQAYEDAVVEDQFWRGTIQPTSPHLTDAGVTVLTGDVDIVSGFASLEAHLATKQQSGLIHCSPRIATYAEAAGLLHPEGQLLRTVLGTIVVPGQGYLGAKPESAAAPAAGKEYAFVTNGVRVIRSPQPTVLGADDAEAVTRGSNDFTIIVEREYVVAWDGAVQAAILINPTPTVA